MFKNLFLAAPVLLLPSPVRAFRVAALQKLRAPLSICSLIFCVLFSLNTKGQCGVDTNILRQRINNNTGYRCALGSAYAASSKIPAPTDPPLSITPPGSFPPGAIVSCGHFTFYYDDVMLGLGLGYDAPGALGPMRRNNLCQVVAYLESVFDFSKVPAGGLRIYVERSDAHSYLGTGTAGSAGMPFFDAPGPGYPTIKGFVADYTQTGADPTSLSKFHGQLGIDFSMPNINSDASVTSSCDIDLFTMELHEMCHILGFFSFIDPLSSDSFSTIPAVPAFSKVDRSLFTTPHPYTSLTDPFLSLTPLVIGSPAFSTTPGAKLLWLNNLQPPKNESVEFTMTLTIGPSCPVYKSDFIDNGLHINDNSISYATAQRLSPGDQESYVLGPKFYEGEYRRVLMKGEIEEFINILNYKYNPTYATVNAVRIFNNKPHSAKMRSVAYSRTYANATTPEAIATDYTITNNTGASLSIDLNTLADLADPDGDRKSVYPGSLVNFRGCGNGDNNHNRLALSSSDQVITYTPGPNFYGRAQFGFNIYDGKEKGGFVIFTINVLRGTNVSLPASGDMVLNGSFEAGSEVKTFGSAASESVNNSLGNNGSKVCRISSVGAHLADSHPWDFMTNSNSGHSIYQSAGACPSSSSYASFLNSPFGGARGNFYPYTEPGLVDYPLSSPGGGHRYQPMNGEGTMFYLAHCLKTCKRYRLSFYGKRTASYIYPAKESIQFGFLNDAHLGSTLAAGLPLLPLPFSPTAAYGATTKAFTMSTWDRAEISFNYCSTDSMNILYLNAFDHFLSPPSFIIDSVRLTEITDQITAVDIEVSNSTESACQRILEAVPVTDDDGAYGCGTGAFGFTYSWTKAGSPAVIGTARTLVTEPIEPTDYTVTIDDGCGHTAMQSITIQPCRCSPYVQFGTTAFTALSGSVPSPLGPGLYYVANDITIPASSSFTDAIMLVKADAKITVANTAKLTIDRSHLFTCPDSNKLWKGIELASSGSSSGRIEVRNNSLIEDAEIAIRAESPRMPVSGDIISSSNSVYNRNLTGIYISNFKSTAALSYPFTFAGNVFTARLFDGGSVSGYPLSWPTAASLQARGTVVTAQANDAVHQNYTKALCKNGIFSNAGISLNEVGITVGSSYYEILVGEASASENSSLNLFDNHGFGIRMNNTNMTSYSNRFINMSMLMEPVARGTLTPYLYEPSAGIFAYTSDVSLRDRLRVLSNFQQKASSFHDCFKGILTINQASVEIRSSDISSSHALGDMIVPGAAYTDQFYEGDGIRIQGHRNLNNVILTGNDISNMNAGAYLYLNNPEEGATMDISGNTFSNSNRDADYRGFSWQYMLQALEVFANFEDRNSTLTINGNTFDSVYNAISVSRAWITKTTISNNNITLFDKTMSTIGTEQFGIKLWNCYRATVNSNDLTTPTLGIATQADYLKGIYAAYNHAATICNNNVSNIGRSFEFSQISPQNWTIWAKNTMQNAWKGFTLGSPIFDQLVIGGVNTPAGNQWLGAWSASKPNTFSTVDSRTSKLSVRSGGGFFEYPASNRSSILGYEYTPTSSTFGSASILIPNTSVYSCTPVAPRLIGDNPLVRAVLTDSLGASIPPANAWMSQLSLYHLAMIDTVLLDSIQALNSFMAAAANSRFAWLHTIETALAQGNMGQAQNLLATPVPAMGRVLVGNGPVVVNDVPDADYVVNNYRRYYGVYLHYLDSSLTGTDTTELEMLALKCPATDGAIVYQARGLLRLFTGLVGEYNDQDCAEQGLYRVTPDATTEGGEQAYTLYPNPNQGSFTIRQNVAEDKMVRIKVLNAIGAQVYQSLSTFKGGKLNVNTGPQAPGLYLVCIDDEKGKNTCLRFVIK
jgi:hypothetical protein